MSTEMRFSADYMILQGWAKQAKRPPSKPSEPMSPTLASIVAQHPYPDFQKWWPLGEPFLAMMADAILGQWRPLAPSSDDLAAVQTTVDEYISLVYKREARPGLAASFAAAT